jgi:hypothetical protein
MAEPVRARRLTDQEGRRLLLHERGISFQRTRTWKESTDPDRDAKLDRTEYVTSACPDGCFASGQSGPLSIRPCHGVCRAPRKRPARLRGAVRSGTHPLSWAAQTTGITPRWPASRRPACAGVMPTPATPACWPPSAANAPASAANASNAGAARNLKLHNRAGARSWPAH